MKNAAIIQDLNRCLEERDRIFPHRDKQNDTEVAKALTVFADQVNCLQQADFIPDKHLVDTARTVSGSPVFLCGPMKSGTTLLLELLDGHSCLTVLPGDSFLIGKLIKFSKGLGEGLPESAWDNWVMRLVNPTGQYPFWIFGASISPYVIFRQYLRYWYEKLPQSWSSLLVGYVLSFYCANPARSEHSRMWIEKTPGNEFHLDLIKEHFPEARFIHIVRDPRENLASLKRLYTTRDWDWDVAGLADTLAGSCRLAVANQCNIGRDHYHVLRYEALTENPKKQMQEVADFLNIPWEDCLLQPTVNKMPAQANSMYTDRQVTGFVGSATQNKWRSVLTQTEQRIVQGTLHNAKKVGYSWENTMLDSTLSLLYKSWRQIKKRFVA